MTAAQLKEAVEKGRWWNSYTLPHSCVCMCGVKWPADLLRRDGEGQRVSVLRDVSNLDAVSVNELRWLVAWAFLHQQSTKVPGVKFPELLAPPKGQGSNTSEKRCFLNIKCFCIIISSKRVKCSVPSLTFTAKIDSWIDTTYNERKKRLSLCWADKNQPQYFTPINVQGLLLILPYKTLILPYYHYYQSLNVKFSLLHCKWWNNLIKKNTAWKILHFDQFWTSNQIIWHWTVKQHLSA